MTASAPNDKDFAQRAELCMSSLQASLDGFDPDELDADLASGVLRIGFADGRNCILNRQAAAHQIWLAEGASAWHFTYDEAQAEWLDTKGRGELRRVLGDVLSRRLGRAVKV